MLTRFWRLMLCDKHRTVLLHLRSHFIPVILELSASAAFGKQKSNQNIILSNSTFYKLSTDIWSVGISLKTAQVLFSFWRTPTKVWSSL